MNILVLTSVFPFDKYPRKDATSVVAFFAREWSKEGHKVVVVVNSSTFPSFVYLGGKLFRKIIRKKMDVSDDFFTDSWSKPFFFMDGDIQVFNCPMKKMLPGRNFSNRVFEKQISHIVNKLSEIDFAPDVITGHWVNPQLRLVSALKIAYPNAKTAFVFHGDYQKERLKRHKVSRYIANIDHIGCRSHYVCNLIKNELGLPDLPFHCPSGVSDDFIKDISPGETKTFGKESISIITAGRLLDYKCFDSVIEAVKKTSGSFLTIAGDGPQKEYLESIAQSNVSFLGKVSRKELTERMKENDVFVLISKHETFGLVYLEAMLQGCIVIASKNGGVDGIIKDGVNGFLCEEGNSEELAGILSKIKKLDVDTLKTISQKAIGTALEYSDSKVARRYLKIITE